MNEIRRIFVVGSANMDLVLQIPRTPLPGETLTGSDLHLYPGGKGANQACAAARMGAQVWMVGSVGSDIFGDRLLGSLQEAGVEVSRVLRSSVPSGCASIYVTPDGQNSIVISPGANAQLSEQDVEQALADLSPADIVLLQLEVPLATVKHTLARAASVGALTILDPAPFQVLDSETLGQIGVFTPNQSEAASMLGVPEAASHNDSESVAITEQLLRSGPREIILKRGEQGCAVRTATACRLLSGYSVNAVDTTAAGDVFNGALAVALAEGNSIWEAAHFANMAAAISVTRAGAQSSIPSREEVEQFRRSLASPVQEIPCSS